VAQFADVQVVFRKEVVEVIRDYKNLLVMAIIPVLFLPLMVMAPQSMVEQSFASIQKQKFTAAVYGDGDDQFVRKSIAAHDPDITFVEPIGEQPDQAVSAGKFDVAVVVPPQFSQNVNGSGEPQSLELVYDAKHPNAVFAFARIHMTLDAMKKKLKEKRVLSAGLNLPKEPNIVYINEGKKAVADSIHIIAMMLPLVLLVIVMIALLSPSIDLFTGEKERGTMPLLMVAPVAPRDIVLGKLAVVCLFGQSAVALGLVSFFVTANFFGRRGHSIISVNGIAPESILLLFFLMLPMVVLLSSLSVLLASKCKTFQQGQGYYLPFMLLVMCPAGVLSWNDASLSSVVALVPIGNICLAMREVLSRNYQWGWLAVIFLISTIYAGLAGLQAVRLFDRTEQLERDEVPRYMRWKRGDYRPEVGLLLATSFLLMFYVGQVLESWDSLSGTALSQLLVVLLPALLAIAFLRLPILPTLSLTKPSWQLLLGALLISPLTAIVAIGVSQLQSMILPVPEAYAKAFLEIVMPAGRSLPVAVIVFAVFPAVCEEILFRGAVLGLLRKKLSLKALILVVGLLFGAFHLSSYRFLPTAILGIILSTLVAVGGSIFPAMVLHASHNALLIIMQVNHWDHPSALQIIALSVSSLVGLVLLWSGLKTRK
jgi:sodium transport system permease protein